jgi:hypothetical protein
VELAATFGFACLPLAGATLQREPRVAAISGIPRPASRIGAALPLIRGRATAAFQAQGSCSVPSKRSRSACNRAESAKGREAPISERSLFGQKRKSGRIVRIASERTLLSRAAESASSCIVEPRTFEAGTPSSKADRARDSGSGPPSILLAARRHLSAEGSIPCVSGKLCGRYVRRQGNPFNATR